MAWLRSACLSWLLHTAMAVRMTNRLISSLRDKSKPVSPPTAPPEILTARYAKQGLDDSEVLTFLREGHCHAQALLLPQTVQALASLMQEEYAARKSQAVSHYQSQSQSRSPSSANSATPDDEQPPPPFMQLFNVWRTNAAASRLILHASLGRLASQLLDVPCVRLYQDALFIKHPSHGPTQWHSDLKMCPFNTNEMVTLWIPLQDVPEQDQGGTGLSYASRSHVDFALPYWFDPDVVDLSERYLIEDHGAYTAGDASFHHGWCLHAAPPNDSNHTRIALSLSFVADGVPLLPLEMQTGAGGAVGAGDGMLRGPDMEDAPSYAGWLGGALEGGYLDTPLCPIVFGGGGAEGSA